MSQQTPKVWFPTVRTRSGSDVFVERLVDGLRARGVEAHISWYPHLAEFCPAVLGHSKPPPGTNIIHVNSWHGFPFARSGIPMVSTCHHSVHDKAYKRFTSSLQALYHRSMIRRYEDLTFNASDTVVAVSEYTARQLREQFDGVKPVVIANGIDLRRFKPERKSTVQNSKFRLLYIGNPSRRKGFDLLPGIMQRLGPEFELAYTTGLSNKQRIIGSNCHWLGPLSTGELIREYNLCDAVLYPTRYEGFGYVACEAMACAKPVISAAHSSIPEVVKDGETGILCQTDNVGQFVTAAQELANNRALQATMGANGRRHVESRFSIEQMVDAYLAIYQQL